ncbi:cytochrome c biogenesis protein ResB [Synoicihabitans lomoniglobus]|uniref:Cytochrome c biogenesis protein ResB n=1 Tax=Synoicihabitans lomoniglobus TaxID=2909285 RepID=A0AAF0CRH2_9BACT|nr:cytochrome c biogenesis protein ResB [Opitutaceae bacterium LMO-M01]WED66725.1 cytochrome c biogenesis protein ResB [Opitutaceae bacterium LMO-M01]
MSDLIAAFSRFFCSLRLTVVLLVMSMVLIFVATLAQVQLGVYGVQEQYFRTFFVLARIPNTEIPLPVFPGGYLIGGFLMINLVAAHVHRFQFTWKKAGIQLTHFGLIVLLVGELVSGLLQEDYSLKLEEGQTRNYSESFRRNEVVIIDQTDADFDDVTAIPESLIAAANPIQHAKLPFRVIVRGYYPNANLAMLNQLPAGAETANLAPNPSTAGMGPRLGLFPAPLTYKDNERNLPVALIELEGAEGSLGIWLVSPMLVQPQTFDYAGRTWSVGFRFEREYKPFSLTLLELKHDVYVGTQIPKNFSSRVRLQSADGTEDRESLIYMNQPLRHQGFTFYQYQMDSANGFSVLQVVHNPGRALPYIACILMSIGLTWQFGFHLLRFTRRRNNSAA